MSRIYYAVIALKASEVETVAKDLEAQGMETIAKWLLKNKDSLYGTGREDWKPFMDGNAIRDLMKTKSEVYESATSLIDENIDDDVSDVSVLLDHYIELYVIDVFALFWKKYINLANKLDLDVAKRGKCLLVIPYVISKEFQETHDLLVKAHKKLWKTVYAAYVKGSLSRTVLVPDDLTNFREYLVTLNANQDQPSLQAIQLISTMLGQPKHTELPRMTP